MSSHTSRRKIIKQLAAGTLALGVSTPFKSLAARREKENYKLKGNINHSVCQWTYSHLSVDELCLTVKRIGFSAIDLVGPKDWPTLQKHGIYSSMCNGAEISLTKGWNDKQYHSALIKNYTDHIELVAKAGYKNLICFSGNRNGMDDETGWKNCVEGLKQVIGLAEKKAVIIHMELLNSKVDHKDQMCDRTPWGVELVKRLGSPNFKLLYDIYHMQIDEGDVIRTIKDNHQYIGHYHTAGVPGRHEINESQELYYPAIMEAILKTGFNDYVAQEFISTGKDNEEKELALKDAVRRCDV
ncbi:MAG: hydroxypyruvate isomerase [Chitinophagaceae bacterium]|nr:MAG: hydroxypyruvate isomerase [Chitinophagaceae bacterium]